MERQAAHKAALRFLGPTRNRLMLAIAGPAFTVGRMMPYRNLKAWQTCHQLALATYRATQSFPKVELYGLTSQMRRAAFSAAANIAEGAAKRGPKEFRRFLDISLGSLSEISYAIHFAKELGYLSDADWKELDKLRDDAGKITWGLYRLICSKDKG